MATRAVANIAIPTCMSSLCYEHDVCPSISVSVSITIFNVSQIVNYYGLQVHEIVYGENENVGNDLRKINVFSRWWIIAYTL